MPQLTVADPIRRILHAVRPAPPRAYGSLTVVPLLAEALSPTGWVTLTEAGAAAEIGEVSEGGAVPDLTVTNRGPHPLLLLDGEELVGAKQNRVLNTTVLVAVGATVIIPVTCVEQGRWRYRDRRSQAGQTSLYASLRRQKTTWVSESVRLGRGHRSDQARTWAHLAARDEAHGLGSPTVAMHDFYVRYATEIAAARAALAPEPDQVGAAVWLAGDWVGLDLLADPGIFAQAWPRLCAGYAADAIGQSSPPSSAGPAIDEVLAAVVDCCRDPAPPVGLGAEYRLSGAGVVGAALVAADRVAHLMAFPADIASGDPRER